MAIFPDYSTFPPQATVSGIPAGTNPSGIDIDPTIGVAVVAEAGSSTVASGVQFYAIAKGALTPIDSTGATCVTSCPVTSQSFANVSISTPTGLSVNPTLHTVAIVNYGNQSVTVLPIPVPGAASQNPAPGTPVTIDISGALQNSVNPAPVPYSIGVDPDSNLALVAYSSTVTSTATAIAANLGFVVNLNPDSATTPNPYGCTLDHAINPSSTKVGQCITSQVTLNTGQYPQIATASHGHLAVVTPGGGPVSAGSVVRGVDVTAPSSANVILSSSLTAGVVTVTIDASHCPPPLPDPNSSATPPTNPCPFTMVPGNAGTVLITGLKPGNSANDAFFNGNFTVNVTSSNSFTYGVVNLTASDSAQGGCQTTTGAKTCATVFYGLPNQTIQITSTLQGVAINPITRVAAMADANTGASGFQQINLLNSLDQSVTSIGFTALCTAFSVPCAGAAELGHTTGVAWQPYTNALLSYNPTINQVSISDPVGRQRYAFVCELNNANKTNAGTSCITNPNTAPVTVCASVPACQQLFLNQITLVGTGTATLTVNNGTTGSLTLWGGIAADPATNQAFVLMSGSGTIDIVDLGGPGTTTPLKPTQITDLLVPSPTPGVGVIGGVPNALVPQATLTCIPPPGSPAGTCNLSGVKIFGAGFVSGLQVRLDGVDITTQGGTINNIASNGREVDVTIPPSFLAVPHHYALDVLSGGAQSNGVNFIVIESVDLSKVCTSSTGSSVNTMPSSVAIADQIANGPFSPFALVSVSGCNSIVKVDLNPASPTFGQLLGSPVSVGTTPQGIAISQPLGLAVVANHGTNTASILDLTKNPAVQITPDVTTGTSPTGVAIDDAIDAAVVANTGANTVSVINLAPLFPPAGTTATAPTIASVAMQQPIAVAIDPDRGANNQGIAVVSGVQLTSGQAPSGSLQVIEIGFTTPIPSTTSSSGFVTSIPTGVVFDPTVVLVGATNPGVFYSNSSGSNTIVQFNPDTGGGSSVNVGVNPTSLAINPQTGAILTSNSGSNTLSIVDTISNPFQTRQTLGLPGSPTFGVAIDQFTNLAVIVDQANMRVLLFPMPN
jgi:DNA-binding beta-propeller fold protein YncE